MLPKKVNISAKAKHLENTNARVKLLASTSANTQKVNINVKAMPKASTSAKAKHPANTNVKVKLLVNISANTLKVSTNVKVMPKASTSVKVPTASINAKAKLLASTSAKAMPKVSTNALMAMLRKIAPSTRTLVILKNNNQNMTRSYYSGFMFGLVQNYITVGLSGCDVFVYLRLQKNAAVCDRML